MKYAFTYTVHLLCTCLLLICLAWFSGCRKLIEVPPPPDVLVSADVFTTDVKAVAAVSSIYGNMINGNNGYSNYQTTLYAGYSSDDLNRFNPSLVFQEFITNSITPANSQLKNLWLTAYKTIYNVNAAIEGIQSSSSLSPAVAAQLVGECKIIRAFTYFYLVNLWGDVPLVTSTDYRLNATLPRSGVTEVYNKIVQDLQEAAAALPNTIDRTRASKWAARALLARVYLYRGQWTEAELEAAAIIASGLFTPLPATNTVFLATSKEAIWQLAPTSGVLKEYTNIRPSGTTPQVTLYPSMVSLFTATDTRKKWFDSVTYQSVKYYYPAKYRNTGTTPTEFYVLLRLAEQYLIRAEARLQKNDLAGAISDINVVKARAGIALLPATATATQISAEIEKERQLELFAEWGHRWLDLKRWNKANAVLAPLKTAWRTEAQLFPIPEDELLANPFLTQNPGY